MICGHRSHSCKATPVNSVAAHIQKMTRHYSVRVPEHGPRGHDPHKADFDEYKRRRKTGGTWYCDFAQQYRHGDSTECDLTHPLECHHSVIEYAMQNGVDLTLLEQFYPGVSTAGVGAWIDSADNLTLLCRWHHRGHGGVHIVSASDWEAYKFVKGLIT